MSHPGGQAYYDSLLQLYASWGIDFVKVDCIFGGRDGHSQDIITISKAIEKTGSEIVLSLSPGLGATPSIANELHPYVNSYRITDDLWDCWDSDSTNPPCPYDHVTVVGAFETLPQFQKLIGLPGLNGNSWPDGDMLPIGWITPPSSDKKVPSGLSGNQQKTLFTLWCMFRNPLMFGGDLTLMDEFTYSILSNEEVLAVQQSSTNNREIYRNGSMRVWSATSDQDTFLAFFNIGRVSTSLSFPLSNIGHSLCSARDCWNRLDLGQYRGSINVTVYEYGALLLRLSKCQ